MLLVDEDFIIDNSIPIKITLSDIVSRLLLDDNLVFKFMIKIQIVQSVPNIPHLGLYLFPFKIETDSSFQTDIKLIVGHDGSKTPAWR